MRRLVPLCLLLAGCHGASNTKAAESAPLSIANSLVEAEDSWSRTIDVRTPAPVDVRILADRSIGELDMNSFSPGAGGAMNVHITVKIARNSGAGGMAQYSTEATETPVGSSQMLASQTTGASCPPLPKGPLSKFVRSLPADPVVSLPAEVPICEFSDSSGKKHTVSVHLDPRKPKTAAE